MASPWTEGQYNKEGAYCQLAWSTSEKTWIDIEAFIIEPSRLDLPSTSIRLLAMPTNVLNIKWDKSFVVCLIEENSKTLGYMVLF